MSDLNQNAGQSVSQDDSVDQLNDLMPGSEQQDLGDNTSEENVDMSERTRTEFEKLKESNRRLKDQVDALSKSGVGSSVYDSIGNYGQASSAPVSPQKATVDVRQFVDSQGNVDIVGLNQTLAEAGRSASEAKAIAEEMRKREDARMVSEAHAKYPWLDPKSDEFDSTGYELVRDRLVSGYARGQSLPLTAVASDVLRFYKPESLKRAEVTQETQERKAQASSIGSQTQNRAGDTSRLQKLREASRRGDQSALDERIRLATEKRR